ncbi:MAG: hypothetical protein KVP17_004017 [Porospora cf. gigantea B]|uniref:uncharacterized protein n=1 Tax=Porospora cf. gigantea B TaxID=2853592 RepID=UPI00357187A0|nr:MAG: hypothetical protein KVP17_004017 [Porospora cf. gigantea B]
MLKILLLMSDTGGGHRASSEALKDAFELFYEGSVCLETVDLWTEHGSFPVNQMVPSYRVMMNNPWLWFATYHSVPNKRALRLFTDTLYLMNHQYVKEYLLEEEPDVVISVHPLCNHVPLRILRELEINEWKHRKVTPFYTVVTDLGVCHITWFARGANRIFVASETTQQFALTHDIPPNNISVVGLPLRRAFWAPFVDNRESLCKRLNLNPRIPVVVVMSGGEGGGGDLADIFASILRTLYAWRTKTCCLLRDACYHDFDRRHEFTSLMEFFLQRRLVQVVVICGKNVHALKQIENINDDIPMGLLTSLKGKVVDTEAQRGKPSSHLDVEETHPDGESDDDTSAKRGDKSSGLNRLMGNLFFNNGDRLLTARQDIYSFVRMLARPDGTGCSSFKISPVGTLHALGFVSNVEDYMHAASVLITKAGPGTIAEAACCRLPCILSSFLPGQEEGNVEYVRNSGIGDYAPTAKTVATQLVQ